jgi:hypothetical protein
LPQEINTGETASFTVATSAAPLAYQWYRNNVPVAGGTSATLTIPVAKVADAGLYHCVIKSNCADLITLKVSLAVKLTDTVQATIQWLLYPNPVAAGHYVTLRGYDGYAFRLSDGVGKVLQAGRITGNGYRIQLPYRAGVYFLHAEKEVTDSRGNKKIIFNYEKVFVQ